MNNYSGYNYPLRELSKYLKTDKRGRPYLTKDSRPEIITVGILPWDKTDHPLYQTEMGISWWKKQMPALTEEEFSGKSLELKVQTGYETVRFIFREDYNENMKIFMKESSAVNVNNPRADLCNWFLELIRGLFRDWKTLEGIKAKESERQRVREILDRSGFLELWENAQANLFPRTPWLGALESAIYLESPTAHRTYLALPGGPENFVVEFHSSGWARSRIYDKRGTGLGEWTEKTIYHDLLDDEVDAWVTDLGRRLVDRLEKSIEHGLDYEKWY